MVLIKQAVFFCLITQRKKGKDRIGGVVVAEYIALIYALIVWGVVFLTVKPKRIKELLPMAILGGAFVWLANEVLIFLGFEKFYAGVLPVAGVPVGHFLWGAGAGIFTGEHLGKINKVLMIIILAAVVETLAIISIGIGEMAFINGYSPVYDIVVSAVSLSIFIGISEKFFGNRIHANKMQ